MAQKTMITKEDLFRKFKNEEKTLHVEAWEADVKIRRLTIKEADEVSALMLGELTNEKFANIQNNEMILSADSFSQSQYLTVSHALVDPKMTSEELGALAGNFAKAGVLEIYSAIQEWDKPKKSKDEKTSLE